MTKLSKIVKLLDLNKVGTSCFLLILTVFSITWVLLYKLIWVNMSPIFENASEYGEITYSILLSIIASYIFYFINVYLPDKEREKKVKFIISNKLKRIKGIIDSIESEIIETSDSYENYEFANALFLITFKEVDKRTGKIKDNYYWQNFFREKKSELLNISNNLIDDYYDVLLPDFIFLLEELPRKCNLGICFPTENCRLNIYKDNINDLFDTYNKVFYFAEKYYSEKNN